MALLNDVADRMAARTLRLIEATGDEELEKKVADEIGASSPTLQEAFSTALRILKAEARAKRYIEKLEREGGIEAEVEVTPAPEPEAKQEQAPVKISVPKTKPEAKPEPEKKSRRPVLPDLTPREAPAVVDDAEDGDGFGFDDDEELIALPGPTRGRSQRG